MNDDIRASVLNAIRDHPQIARAAVTGSLARQGASDSHSDLDVLIVARDLSEVRNVRAWLPQRDNILIAAFHLWHYCTVLLRGPERNEKIDLAIFSFEDPSSTWVVHDYNVIKGDEGFEADLALAAGISREERAAHRNSDVCIDNVLLLLVTAVHRADRGEDLSAHGFIAMAADMILALSRREYGIDSGADLLDPRRRIEKTQPELALALHESVFVRPHQGIERLARYLSAHHRQSMTGEQSEVLNYLLKVRLR